MSILFLLSIFNFAIFAVPSSACSFPPLNHFFIDNIAKKYKIFFTIEEHNIFGGLGSAVAEFICSLPYNNILKIIGVEDTFGESGNVDALFEKYKIDYKSLAKKILEVYKKN